MNISTATYQKLNHTLQILRGSYSLFFLLIGLDKFVNWMAHWQTYISPLALQHVTFTPAILAVIAGILEIGIAVLIITQWARTGAYCGFAWLLLLTANVLALHAYLHIALFFAIAAIGAFTLGRLVTITERIANEDVV
ncbi:hypothetical protein H0X48_01250 [Candidatus Dependentiae bacterium]|nr:hypothetical protein [Candidatus Dependentiae bacterium]